MARLAAVGVATTTYTSDTALGSDAAIETEGVLDNELPSDDLDCFIQTESSPLEIATGEPLLFCYDIETTGGSHFSDRIIEVASTVIIPEGATITTPDFSSLSHTSHKISPIS